MGVLAVAGDLVEDVVVHVQEPVRPGSDADVIAEVPVGNSIVYVIDGVLLPQ